MPKETKPERRTVVDGYGRECDGTRNEKAEQIEIPFEFCERKSQQLFSCDKEDSDFNFATRNLPEPKPFVRAHNPIARSTVVASFAQHDQFLCPRFDPFDGIFEALTSLNSINSDAQKSQESAYIYQFYLSMNVDKMYDGCVQNLKLLVLLHYDLSLNSFRFAYESKIDSETTLFRSLIF